jgi:hypothetical protein
MGAAGSSEDIRVLVHVHCIDAFAAQEGGITVRAFPSSVEVTVMSSLGDKLSCRGLAKLVA